MYNIVELSKAHAIIYKNPCLQVIIKEVLFMGWIITITIIAYFIIGFISGKIMETVAALKGYGTEAHAFIVCLFFGIIGCIYVAALPNIIQQEQNKKIIELLENAKNEKM